MNLHKKLVSNEGENIKYWINDGEVKIDKRNKNLEELFYFSIYSDKRISFEYHIRTEFSGVSRSVRIYKYHARNPFASEYTYEIVRNYLSDKNKTDEQKIEYIEKLLKDYFVYYAHQQYWEVF